MSRPGNEPGSPGSKLRGQKEHNSEAEWINNMEKELDGLKEGPKVKTHLDSLRVLLK